jgi:hypothetical protein
MSKKKIFYALSVFLLLGMTMSALSVKAHPPINVDIHYYVGRDDPLSIIFTHGVSDPTVHYISSIEVWVNVTQRWVEHGSEGKYDHHGIYYWDLDNYAIAVPPPLDPSDVDPYHSDYYLTVAPNYTFLFDEQPTDITPITNSHTLAHYNLDVPGLQKTGKLIENQPTIEDTDIPIGFLGEGRTNITIRANCTFNDWEGNPSSLTEHYYVGLPYYNPHLTFAEAAIPATVSTIVVFALLFILPKLGQKSVPKLKEGKIKH